MIIKNILLYDSKHIIYVVIALHLLHIIYR